ncbi:hypothetical protein [Acetobacter indonesiensis]|uniref:hypothetical protein n=1 Tax=Acetobacter indonesiensis TaxID=104101 RepID=UPI0020A36272|nr:hypothetical protein [Acetobacter indonesiensis]MCP1231131.1 hypothetical protein [Acetobacter indonesiensis]
MSEKKCFKKAISRFFLILYFLIYGQFFLAASSVSAASQKDTDGLGIDGFSKNEIETVVHKFVGRSNGHQITRWNTPICPDIEGLKTEYSDVILKHIRRMAEKLHVESDGACKKVNLLIYATDDSQALMESLIKSSPNLWQDRHDRNTSNINLQSHASEAVNTLEVLRPVRWFFAKTTVSADGSHTTSNSVMGFNINIVRTYDSTVLSSHTEEMVSASVIIIDIPLSSGVTLGALADYVTMVVFANPALGSDFQNYTIMNLFQNGRVMTDAPEKLTHFDEEFLQALYLSDPDQAPNDQIYQISKIISKNIRH